MPNESSDVDNAGRTVHLCEVDAEPIAPAVMESLDAPCRAPARKRAMTLWMCDRHYEMHVTHMKVFKHGADGNPLAEVSE